MLLRVQKGAISCRKFLMLLLQMPRTKDSFRISQPWRVRPCCPLHNRRGFHIHGHWRYLKKNFLVFTVYIFLIIFFLGGIHHETAVAASKPNPENSLVSDLRSRTVDRLWSITENLNILYRENWTRLAAEEVIEFQEALMRALRSSGGGYQLSDKATGIYYTHEHKWSFSSSFLYSLTLITTIGEFF